MCEGYYPTYNCMQCDCLYCMIHRSCNHSRKGDKLTQRWLGPYRIEEHIGNGVYRLANPVTGRLLKKAIRYYDRNSILVRYYDRNSILV